MANSVPYIASIHGGLSGYITGCIPSNNGSDATNDIDFSVGRAFDGTRGYAVAAMTKQANAGWALGTAAGGMASSAGTPKTFSSTTDYHWFLLLNPSTGETDYGCDTLVTAADLLTTAAVSAAGFTVALRATSFRTGGSAAWPVFSAREIGIGQVEYVIASVFQDTKDWAGADDTAQTGTLVNAPGGLKLLSKIGAMFTDTSFGSASALLISSFDQPDTAAGSGAASFVGQLALAGTAGDVVRVACEVQVRTNTSREFRYRGIGTTVDHTAGFCLHGWIDTRI
jgi:hypothetical protein